jgi:hypothetical protein
MSTHITFVPSKSLESVESTNNIPDEKSGDDASEFYKRVISCTSQQDIGKSCGEKSNSLNKQESATTRAWCSDCELWVDTMLFEKHVHGTAHLMSIKHDIPPPDPIVLNEVRASGAVVNMHTNT